MSEIVDSVSGSALRATDPVAMERRLFRTMCVTVASAVLVSAPLWPWRVTTGLLLGGVLSLFNHHWLRTSLGAVFSTAESGRKVKFNAARYVLRYFIIAGVVGLAYTLNLVSIVATLLGLCSFVAAAMVEAFMQVYFAIVNREET
ncbi:MAG TPA: ATP synthase subunit I [Pyrinomonadaceae bacterium]